MHATTVRVDDATKRDLDRMQGLIQAETGRRLTHSELLSRLLRVARRHEAELLREGVPDWRPPSADQLDLLLAPARRVRAKSDAAEIDDALYGGSPHA
ncbi:MAG: hypothetical protein HYT80_11215 [Euryarchaeota archaeon]|nr:hypothetical protein [Euryarchaeota archaeon]